MNRIREILILHHSHTDIGFTHPQPILWELQNRFIDRALDLLDETADWPEESQPRWTCETTAPVVHWLKRAGRTQIRRFRTHAESGRLSIGAMLFHFTPLVGVDELARSLQPVRDLRSLLGAPIRVAVVHDVNGIPAPCTQLLLDAGVEMLIMGINTHFGGFPLTRPIAFQWEGSDGRSLMTFNGEHYQLFDRLCGLDNPSPEKNAEGLQGYVRRLAEQQYPYDFAFLTATHHTFCDNNPPNAGTAAMIRKWNEDNHGLRIRYVTPEMLLERLQLHPALPRYAGEWEDYWSFGMQNAAREVRISRDVRRRLATAELAGAASGGGNRQLMTDAWDRLLLFQEHTFGSCFCVEHPEFDDSATQWNLKAAQVYEARSLANLLARDQLDWLAGNPVEAQSAEGMLLLNPAATSREAFVRVPKAWTEGTWSHISSNIHFIDVLREKWDREDSVLLGPFPLPPYGWRILSLDDLGTPEDITAEPSLGAAAGEGITAGGGFIESPYYRLEFDAATGRITSLRDKQLAAELIDSSSPWPFFSLVQETVRDNGGRDALFDFDWLKIPYGISCWKHDWPARRETPGKLRSCVTRIERDGVSLVLKWAEAPGVDALRQEIKLCARRPAVEMLGAFRKLDISAPESIYFAFPLALRDWSAHFDSTGQPVEFDGGQLPGTCRDYTCASAWVAMHDARHCVTLAIPDSPMLQIGGFHFGKEQQSVPRDTPGLLLAWVMTNYYNVNFRGASQPDWAQFRYELTSQPRFDARASTAAGAEAAHRIDFHPVVKLNGNREGRLAEVTGAVLEGIRPAADAAGFIVMLSNISAQPSAVTFRIPQRPIRQAWRCGTLEENREELQVTEGWLTLEMPPRSIATVRVEM
jgi:hypothetical protein